MKYVVFFFAFISLSKCIGQNYNLVPNYSFEDSVICPSVINRAPMPRPWYIPSNFNTALYLNRCSSYFGFGVPYNIVNDTSFQYAKTGNGYAAFDPYIPSNNERSYLQVKLNDSLQTGKCYHCTFWVSLSNSCSYATNNIALWFSKTKQYVDTFVSPYALLSANPQVFNYGNPVIKDTQNWVKVSSIYVAQGGEQFITIGNFKNDSNTIVIQSYPGPLQQVLYYVDDVSVIPLDSLPLKADAGPDTTIASGDSVFIGSLTNGITNIKWYNSSGAVINTTEPGLYVRPTASTFYVVEQTVCGYYSRDTVYVNVGALPMQLLSFTATAVSNTTVSLKWHTANEFNVSHFNIQRSYRGTNAFENIGSLTANNRPNNAYSFEDVPTISEQQKTVLYRIQSVDKDGTIGYSPIRQVTLNRSPSGIVIYPNPATNFIIVKGNNIKQVELINSVGVVIYSKTNNSNISRITMENFSNGIYLVRITSNNNEVVIRKVFKN